MPGRSIEKNVDLLKGKSLSLWQEEVDEEDRGGRETGEYEVCSVPTKESAMLPGSLLTSFCLPNVGDHVWYRASDDEVKQPVGCSTNRHS